MEEKLKQNAHQLKTIDNRFIIDTQDLIGQGQYGKVYRAYDRQSQDSQICVKVINFKKFINNQKSMNNIQREIQSLKLLQEFQHPNVVCLVHDFVSSTNIYLFMEFCNSGTLEEFLQKRGVLTESEVIIILKQLADAFVMLNQQNIIHRDLKPANIMVNNNIYKIADFGFSRIVENFDTAMQISRVGTPLYMSPQLLLEGKTEGGKCDVWSMGIIMYELLYGKHPWKVQDLNQLKNLLQKGEIQFPSQPIRSKNIKNLLLGMLQKDENVRFTWQQVIDHDIFKLNENFLIQNEKKIKEITTSKFLTSSFLNCIYQNKNLSSQQIANKPKEDPQVIISQFQQLKNKRNEVEKLEKVQIDINEIIFFKRDIYLFLDRVSTKIQKGFDNKTLKITQFLLLRIQFCFLKNMMILINKLTNILRQQNVKKNDQISQSNWSMYCNSEDWKIAHKIVSDDLILLEDSFIYQLKSLQEYFQVNMKTSKDPKFKELQKQYAVFLNDNFEENREFIEVYKQTISEILGINRQLIQSDIQISKDQENKQNINLQKLNLNENNNNQSSKNNILILTKYILKCYFLNQEFEKGKDNNQTNFFQIIEEIESQEYSNNFSSEIIDQINQVK